jgi:hypothetical protein
VKYDWKEFSDALLAMLIGAGPVLALILAAAIAPYANTHQSANPSIINVPSIAHMKETPRGLVKPE